MKLQKTLIALIIAVAAGGAGFGLYQAGLKRGMAQAQPAQAAPRKPLYWQDPMVPGQKFDKPGKSPYMDMELVPVYGDAASDQGAVSVSARLQQNLGVRTAVATRGRLATRLAVPGTVAYNERDLVLVQARSGGFVEKLYVRAQFDPVKKGQPLVDLYVPDWIAAQEDFLAARRMTGSGIEGLAAGARQRMRLAGMGDEQIRLVESTGKVHPRLTLVAPVGGVVTELSVREGMTVAAGAPLFRINGNATVWVYAEVPESEAARVHPGAAVQARTPSLPGAVFTGRVGALLPEVSAGTRTLKARIELVNPAGQLVPGMFATLALMPGGGRDAVLVPSEAVIQTGTRSVVMLALGEGKFRAADVETGAEADGQTEIRKGLEAGQKVVVSGQFLIDSEASLKGSAARMDPSGAQQ